MATEPTQPQEKTRDEEIREWNESNSMLKGKAGNSKRSGIAIAVAAVVACGFAYMVTHGDDETENKDTLKKEELVAASPRKVMDPPPRREAAKVAPVSNEPGAPADTPRSVVDRQQQGAMSDEERRRQQLEMQAQLEREKMLAARQRSAIFATAKDEGFDQEAGQGANGQSDGGSLLGGGGRSSSQGPMNANDAFAASTYSDSVPFTEARVMENLGYKVLQGAVIEATLQPRAQSQLPGQICASIAQDVYAAEGRRVMLPWGSLVCGSYNASLKPGQERLFTIWNFVRIPRLDGRPPMEIPLNSAGTDQLGTAGQGGVVDNHWAQIFGVAAAVSIIGAGASNSGVSSSDQENSSSRYRSEVQEAAADSAQTILGRYANIQPTVTVPHGSRVVIYLQRDLDFTKAFAKQAERAESGGVTFIN
ncbi:Type IV secretion system protein virB10 (plasmid) [Pseudomonas hunanensis]|uniref:TrbI/VirB10 family protein n=1 Tax=Pseudomonas TaxID=286 RepID=UPI000653A4AD|nr:MULTISPECIES: TrbI/VirB10 family protein [Pseudomonas]EKT4558038.1 TrbI/VirB10 family protein [Pseudomonas putida]BDD36675.1 mating pair formation protein [uncultured bacterium]KMN22817.1 mating pair formation protein [Pseudomonas helleri]KMN22877.1 mating pair formation protein [Pseudomonas helleri]MBO2923717.1 TrbI/VirB10 family protein [Pseudomonas asiatica]